MYDKGKVLGGILIFLLLVLFPIWYSAARGGTGHAPELNPGTDAKTCVEDPEWMRSYHMELLDGWRNDVVRGEGDDLHVSPDGTRHEKSLTRTCLGCHTKKAEFCDRCHEYVAVTPYCWDCHNVPGDD